LAALGALLLVLALPGNVLAQGVPQETAQAECSADRVDLRGAWGTASFRIELADTAQKRGRGLMFRTGMEADAGMLFVYPRAGEVSFWMKNTLIPLDMIFADATGRVRKVHANAIPGDLRPISGGQDILVVLEINGGLSAEIGIEPGTQLRHPALGSAALWPC
jgi:uncharacterized membrane protein (UPF0127 family)